jgi:hypothetical protein
VALCGVFYFTQSAECGNTMYVLCTGVKYVVRLLDVSSSFRLVLNFYVTSGNPPDRTHFLLTGSAVVHSQVPLCSGQLFLHSLPFLLLKKHS